jgi:hypothetical protein
MADVRGRTAVRPYLGFDLVQHARDARPIMAHGCALHAL